MRAILFLAVTVIFYSCNSFSVNNPDSNPIPVHVVGKVERDTATNGPTVFRAMGAGENNYIVKAKGTDKTTIEYLFVSAKPFSAAASHEIDFVIKDANGAEIFESPLPLVDESFTGMVQFPIGANESCELRSASDRFTYLASGVSEAGK
jgi:hypothetical protein